MELTHQQKLEFHENGYLKIPGVVPSLMIDATRHTINHSLDEEGMNNDELSILRGVRKLCFHTPFAL